MALVNAIMNGSYTTVTIDAYNAQDNCVSFNAVVYLDSTKKKKLTQLKYSFKGFERVELLSSRGVSSFPLAPEISDKILVGPNPSGDTAAYEHGTWLTWLGVENGWVQTEKLEEMGYFYIEDEDAYAQWVGGELYTLDTFFTPTTWATYFDITVIDQEGYTLLKGCYDYLKSTPEFASATDA